MGLRVPNAQNSLIFAVQGAGKAQGQTYEPQIGSPTKTPKKCGEVTVILSPTPPPKKHSHQTTMYLDHHPKLLFLLLKAIFRVFFYKRTALLYIFGAGDVIRYITERPHNAQIQLRSISDVPREIFSRS